WAPARVLTPVLLGFAASGTQSSADSNPRRPPAPPRPAANRGASKSTATACCPPFISTAASVRQDMADASSESLSEYYDIVSKVFGCEAEGFRFYNKYALEKGFSVRKTYVEWDKSNQEICLRKLVCSREGFREAKYMNREDRKRRPRDVSCVGCKAKMVIAQDNESGYWYVKDFIDEHNHPLAPKDLCCLLRSHRRISDEQKADIVEMEIAGIRKHQIMDIMEMQYGGYDKVGFTPRDIYNFCYRYKRETIGAGDAEMVISHFKAIQQRDPEFFFKYLVDGEGHLNGLFWCDSQSRLDYEAFGDVVVFDSTYRTNRYNMPFVPFVGLNHHRSTVIFGCRIISHETSEAYEWMLRNFLLAMGQKQPISVITDGDLAMQRAIRVVWTNSNHRLCVWHIEQNIIRNLHDDAVKEEFRTLMYDCCSAQQLERKWVQFLERNQVKSEESWLHQMYQMRKLWCAAYQVGRCFLGLRSNQRSESLNSKLHTHLNGQMTLFGMVQHYDHCLSDLRRNEAILDIVALQTVPFTDAHASIYEKEAARYFTPTIFYLVKWSIHAANNCIVTEILDSCDVISYVVAKKDRRETRFNVNCEFNDESLYRISCSCRKLECFGIPCSHIFHVLAICQEGRLPRCCVNRRWTKMAKCAMNPTRKSTTYEYSLILQRYRELRKLSHAASFRAAQSSESYQRLKRVLCEDLANKDMVGADNEGIRVGPILPRTIEPEFENTENVLDPIRVPGRGAPKKRMKCINEQKKKRSTVKCGHCKVEGHNRRTCLKAKEVEIISSTMLDSDVSD
ncbi:hypothetical protein U9M48_040448, partial [Paspalum notatum var. saurae]